MITFEINGQEFVNVISSECSDGLDQLAAEFSFVVPKLFGIKKGDTCDVYIDDELFTTGYVFGFKDNQTPDDYLITVNGFSKTKDLVDSNLEGLTIEGDLSLGDAITEILKNVNSDLDVIDESKQKFDKNEKISTDFGDNAFATISSYARKKQTLVTSNEDGNLLLTRGVEKDSGLVIANRENGNVLGSSAFENDESLYSEYSVKSQLNVTLLNIESETDPKVITDQDGKVLDSRIRKTRVMRTVAEKSSTSAMCEDRAAWMYAMMLSRSWGVSYTLSGHSQNGKLFKKGETVSVEDETRNIDDTLLIKKVSYNQDNEDAQKGGNTVTVELVPVGSYRVLASEPVAAKKESIFTLE
jgi:prophage tail gpP-like protein